MWLVGERDPELKLGLARQCGDEAKHYRLIEKRLVELGHDLSGHDPLSRGHSPMFRWLKTLESPAERVAAGPYAREGVAVVRNRVFADFCEARGDAATAALYRDVIGPDEAFHHELGRIVADLRAAQALLQLQAASHWRHALAGTLRDEALVTQGTQTATWIATTCVRVADACFALGGGSALYDASPLQRRLRDLHAAAQHAIAQQRNYASAGKLVLSSIPVGANAAGNAVRPAHLRPLPVRREAASVDGARRPEH